MSKKKTNPTKANGQQPQISSPNNYKHLGRMEDACKLLGIRRPNDKLAAIAAARTLKSEWNNGGASQMARAMSARSDITNCFRAIRHSPSHPAASALVAELARDVPSQVANHPEWRHFISELQSAVS